MKEGYLLEEGEPTSWLHTKCEINVSLHNANVSCHEAYTLRPTATFITSLQPPFE
jgi:hypothetical protein